MPKNSEMPEFLYTILKQLNLKSIDWNQVSSELGISTGHAARMRYSRFKQQMEGNKPVRQARNPNAKQAPEQKRPKVKDKNSHKVKLKDSPSMTEHMPNSSPSANFNTSQGSYAPAMPESVVMKSEPREDPESPETLEFATAGYNSPSMPIQSMKLPDQVHQPGPVLTMPLSYENIPDFTYDAAHQQIMLQSVMPQMHAIMGRNMNEEAEQRGLGFMSMDMYNPMNEVGYHGHMIKVEHWNSFHSQ